MKTFHIVFQMMIATGCMALIASFLPKRWKWCIAAPGAVFLTAQWAALYMEGSFINECFWVHLDLSNIRMTASFFFMEWIVALLLVALQSILLYNLANRIRLGTPIRLTCIASLVGLSLSHNGMAMQLTELPGTPPDHDIPFDEALRNAGLNPATFVMPKDVKAEAGQNVIVISLESFEAGFLSEKLAHLTPNLRKLATDMTYYHMTENDGSNWTAGAIYTMVYGLPSFFYHGGNELFQKTSDIRLTGLGHVLHKAGYDVKYMMGHKEFAGMDDLLTASGFKVLSEKDSPHAYPACDWGLHDKDLFDWAGAEIKSHRGNKQPFALFLSTISTHPPDGVYDSRIESRIAPQRSRLETMAAATDAWIGDLVDTLARYHMLDNTTLFILPDHIMMGYTARVVQDFPEPRELFLITNADTNLLPVKPSGVLSKLDLPRMILAGAGIHHNARFLKDDTQQADINAWIAGHKEAIRDLNETSLTVSGFAKGIDIEPGSNGGLHIWSENADAVILNPGNKDTTFSIRLDNCFRLVSATPMHARDAWKQSTDNWQIIVQNKQGMLHATLRRGTHVCLNQLNHKIRFSEDQLLTLQKYFYAAGPFQGDTLQQPQPWEDVIFLAAAKKPYRPSTLPSQICLGNTSYRLNNGINMLVQKPDGFTVRHFQANDAEALIRLTEQELAAGRFFALAGDSTWAHTETGDSLLRKNGLPKLAGWKSNTCYLAFGYGGLISEYTDTAQLAFVFPRYIHMQQTKQEIMNKASDKERFIAHAGGMIDGHRYTNSLEALDKSYGAGFRLFELDIRQTSDGVFVAAHDWGGWRKITGYKGDLPPDHATFMSFPIYGQYHPLDMQAINAWFRQHPDAVLVTDKVNDPVAFAAQFTDRKRLMMELFSVDAVKQGIHTGIRAVLVTEEVLYALPGDHITALKNLHATHVAVSRITAAADPDLFRALQQAGIKTYVYHLNQIPGKDEGYVVRHELDNVYGMYADEWTFPDADTNIP
ncbi:MAG: sulfatase-like hydrolase/transferase [Flavobacteriales bacterium]|nr:sulfatase-like hydrolase/transferase [Flavobacteriales bacterium]